MPVLGGPVVGEEFYDRKALIKELKKGLPHAHYAMVGPRRTGKSSLLRELMREGVGDFVPAYINVRQVVPRSHLNFIKVLGREVLYASVKKKGLFKSMPRLIIEKAAKLADWVRENLRIKISDWLTLYFEASPDLTELLKETFETIESYDEKPLVMIDEITGLIGLSGAEPRSRDIDFMWGLREYFMNAKKARYIISGSQTGVMDILLTKETGPFMGSFVIKKVEALEEEGADELIADKIKRKIPVGYAHEVKGRTRSWPLYLQAYCLATNAYEGKLLSVADVEEKVFGLLHGHFLYMEGLLSESELRVLVAMGDDVETNKISKRLNMSYNTIQSILRRLELKGFAEKTGGATYEPLDHVFKEWLRREYASGDMSTDR